MPVAKTNSQQKQAYERLRWLLILQQIPAGERLRETEWSRKLGVHRTSLREALARLEAEGLIETGESTGYFVPRVRAPDVREVNEIRFALEGLAIDRICRLGLNSPKHLVSIKEAADRFEQCIREGYLLGSAEAYRRFHEALVDGAESRRLSILSRRAPLPLIHQEMANPAVWMAGERRTSEQHHAILSALRAGRTEKATRILHDHLLSHAPTPDDPQNVPATKARRKR
jgi:DNA-binding GntR family transcriptional regulator